MANHPPHAHNPNDGKTDETPRPPTSDEQLRAFWLKNEKSIYIACAVVIVVVVIFTFWRSIRSNASDSVSAAYTAAVTSDQLRTFINNNPSGPLAAAAALRIADSAYTSKNFVEAASYYEKAAADKTVPFAPRALLGLAMSKVMGGQNVDGENRLTQIVNDTALPSSIRAEAAFHLATLASTAGRTDDASKLYDQVISLAPKSLWADNATYQRDHMSVVGNAALPITVAPAATATPATATPAAASGTSSELPAVSFPAQ